METHMADMKYGYTLNLSQDEMVFIRDVLNLVGGDPTHSRRKYADKILEAIYQDKSLVPVSSIKDVKHDSAKNMYSRIWFTMKNGEV
jgi:hypothetical protein